MPSDAPEPMFSSLSCPTDNVCWATGSDAVPEVVRTAHNGGSPLIVHNGGSPLLFGTVDGGSTWSNVTFSVPQGVSDYEGQSYLSIGGISCPSSGLCVALGAGAQSSPSVPTYSLVVPK